MNRTRRFVLLAMITASTALGCGNELTGPTPSPASIEPPLVCVEQLTTSVTIRGMELSPLPIGTLTEQTRLELPQVTLIRAQDIDGNAAMGPSFGIPDDSSDPASSRVRWASQEEMSFEVFPELALEPGLYDIRVTNRNGNEGTLVTGLLGVPRPRVDEIRPDLLCGEQDNAFTLTGDYFLQVNGDFPTVTIGTGDGAVSLEPTLGDCRGLPGTSGAQACRTAQITIPADALPPGNYQVVLTNPAPANCVSSDPQQLTIVPRPTVTEIEPELACLEDGGVTVTITGSDFLDVDGVTPTLFIGDQSYTTTIVASSCTELDVMRETVQTCTQLTAVVPEDSLTPGAYAVVVQNPPPADCSSEDVVSWTVVPSPTVAAVIPSVVCSDGTADTTLTVEGTGFLVIDGASPTVAIGAMSFAATADASSCTEVELSRTMATSCTRLSIVVPAGTYDPGTYPVVVTNPSPAGCGSSEPVNVTFVSRPDITGVVPTRVCTGGGTLAINGSGFAPSATVTLDGTPAARVTYSSATSISATFGGGIPVGGPYDLVVSNAPGCDDTLSGVVTVITGPQIFFADPPVLYSGINTQVLLYVTGITDTVRRVAIRPSEGGAETVLTHSWSAARPNRLQITVPSGLPAGRYDVILEDVTDCAAFLARGLTITSDLTVSVTDVDPPFGWTSASTAVTISGESPPPAGFVGFQPVPRLYLNPSMPSASTVATPIEAVTLLSSSRATALVPSGLPVGDYDLIVVNPDGTVGLLPGAFEVTALPPPVVATITPGSVPNSASQSFTVLGANFRAPDVTLRCLSRDGTLTPLTATESGATATQVTATINASALTEGAICVIRVTNDDGTYGEFSALTITNPAQNLGAPVASTDLGTARRALGAVSASATRSARFVYAIGGDSGALTGALRSVESMPVDIFGNPGSFTAQRYELTTPRTFVGTVQVGRFLYAIGGHDGTSPLASIERAFVLDPERRPQVADLEIQVVLSGGLPSGLYYYRVAALMAAADPLNPSGETLASEAFPVILPSVAGRGLQVVIDWTAVPGAVGYRIYRSPMADAPAGSELLLAEVTGGATTRYTDTGATTVGTGTPLPIGSTGRWHTVGSLATARYGAGVTAIPDPVTAGLWHLYVVGGRGASANLASIEIVPVTIAAGDTQTVGTIRTATAALGTGRWQLGVYGVTNAIASRVTAATPWLYAVGGTTSATGGSATGTAEAFPIAAGGDLGTRETVDMMSPAGAGFGHVAANNFLHAFGGLGGDASSGVLSAEICSGSDPRCGGGPPNPPDLVNWNNAGVSLGEARLHMGTASLPGFIYLLGGFDGTAVLRSTEWSNW